MRICLLIVLGLAGCRPSPRSERRYPKGSCLATCEEYMACRGEENARRLEACTLECRSIFMEETDRQARILGHLQSLSCPKILDFIEGPKRRPVSVDKS